jgi:hypothetical protein
LVCCRYSRVRRHFSEIRVVPHPSTDLS